MIPFYFLKGNKCTKKCNFVVILMTVQDLTYLLSQFGPTNCSTIWWAIKPMDLSVWLDFLGHIFYFTSSNTPLAIYNTRLFSPWNKNVSLSACFSRYLCLRVASKSNQVFPLTMTQRSFQKNKSFFTLYFSWCVCTVLLSFHRWYWWPDGFVHWSQHPHHLRAVWLRIWGLFQISYCHIYLSKWLIQPQHQPCSQ